jgi:hypothetical protein
MQAACLIPVSNDNEAEEGAGSTFLVVLTIVRDVPFQHVPFQPPAIDEAPPHIATNP